MFSNHVGECPLSGCVRRTRPRRRDDQARAARRGRDGRGPCPSEAAPPAFLAGAKISACADRPAHDRMGSLIARPRSSSTDLNKPLAFAPRRMPGGELANPLGNTASEGDETRGRLCHRILNAHLMRGDHTSAALLSHGAAGAIPAQSPRLNPSLPLWLLWAPRSSSGGRSSPHD
jgi:hypothetical protein